jgi:integrase
MNRPRKKDRHLPACVHFRHGAYYYVKGAKWRPLGKDLRSALAQYATFMEAPEGSMPKLIWTVLDHLRPKLKPATVAQYTVAAKKLAVALIEFNPQDVKPRDVAEIKVGMSAHPNMANRCLSFLRQVFDYALEHGLVDSNPAIGVKRHAEKKRTRLLSQVEFDAIYAQAGERLQVVMELLRFTGQRVVDVLQIRESAILAEGIRFRQQKTDAYLTVKWTPGLTAAVARARGLQGNVRTLTLLTSRWRKAPDYRSVRDQWEVACKAAGVEDAHLHDLRAMSATRARSEGLNATKLLGHSSAKQTERYLRDREAVLVEGPSFGQVMDTGQKKL